MKIRKKYTPPERKTARKGSGKKGRNTAGSRGTGEASFRKELQAIGQRELKERLDGLLAVIDQQGEKLKKTLDQQDLLEYRKKVKEYLQVIQKEYSRTRQLSSWDRRGNLRTYRVLEQVDERLSELYQLFVEEQTDSLEVLQKLDEIRGLLMDLYI